jgi:pyrroline-5-carboxylate reductase
MVCGATRTLLESGLTPAEVMDLIPVKPLADMEAQVTRDGSSGVWIGAS